MASKLAALQDEENRLLEIKEKLKDQLRRLQVEELALRSMLQPSDITSRAAIVDVDAMQEESTDEPKTKDVPSSSNAN